jgi:hypothetical protein
VKRAIGLIALALTLGAVPMLMGPSGGYPSRPQFQAVGVGTTAPAIAGLINLTGNATTGFTQISRNTSNGATSFNSWRLQNDASHTAQIGQTSSTAASAFVYTGGPTTEQMFLGTNENVPVSFGVNGVEVMRLTSAGIFGASSVSITPTSGTFSSTPQATGCTTFTINLSYKKIGAMVVLKVLSRTGFPAACSGGTMIDNSGAIPVSLRPTTNTNAPSNGLFTNNATSVPGCLILTSGGNLNWAIVDGTGCNSGGWTGVGNRDFGVGSTFVYSTD